MTYLRTWRANRSRRGLRKQRGASQRVELRGYLLISASQFRTSATLQAPCVVPELRPSSLQSRGSCSTVPVPLTCGDVPVLRSHGREVAGPAPSPRRPQPAPISTSSRCAHRWFVPSLQRVSYRIDIVQGMGWGRGQKGEPDGVLGTAVRLRWGSDRRTW